MRNSNPVAKRYLALPLLVLFTLCLWVSAWAQDELPRPLTLEDAFGIALERNPSVAAAESELEGRHANTDAQKGRRLPTLTAGWNWNTQQSLSQAMMTGTNRSTSRDLSLTLNHTFYESGLSESISPSVPRTSRSRPARPAWKTAAGSF